MKSFSIAFIGIMSILSTPAIAETGLAVFTGNWSGTYTAVIGDKKESFRCTSYISPNGGSGVRVTLRCANKSLKVADLTAHVAQSGNSISGSWEAREPNGSGTLTGTLAHNSLRSRFEGSGARGSLNVTRSGNALTVAVHIDGKGPVTVSLSK